MRVNTHLSCAPENVLARAGGESGGRGISSVARNDAICMLGVARDIEGGSGSLHKSSIGTGCKLLFAEKNRIFLEALQLERNPAVV